MSTTRTPTPDPTRSRAPRRRRAALAVAAALATSALVTGCGATSTDRPEATEAVGEAPTGTSVVVRPTQPIEVHEDPDASSPARTVEPETSFGSPTALLVTDLEDGWVEVLVPGRPNGSTGWVPVDQAGPTRALTTEVRVDLAARTLTLLDQGDEVISTPVAIGSADFPTPTGRFSVTDKLDTQDPAGPYGQYAIGLSGRSEILTEFGGGDGQIGIHGTDDAASIGTPASHGCIRVPSEVMAQLNSVLALGTPVVVS